MQRRRRANRGNADHGNADRSVDRGNADRSDADGTADGSDADGTADGSDADGMPFGSCDAQPQGQQCLDEGPSQHFGTAASIPGLVCQTCMAAPCIERSAFIIMADVATACQGSSDGSSPGFFLENFHLELLDDHPQQGRGHHGVGRWVAAARP